MLGRLALAPRLVQPMGARFLSDAAKPMTRFIQYPFDKTKMAEVREWCNSTRLGDKLRAIDGVKNVELSFCPGHGWLAARYIFNDLEDLKKFGDQPGFQEAKEMVLAMPHFDKSREPQEFKGFFLPEA
mmetsp:Transcript_69409/g.137240  ORF Transcript_69409/g.137240 Transcript_69409/m.137240 type:complete len:128 (-) Transcript_69409:90-473(-)